MKTCETAIEIPSTQKRTSWCCTTSTDSLRIGRTSRHALARRRVATSPRLHACRRRDHVFTTQVVLARLGINIPKSAVSIDNRACRCEHGCVHVDASRRARSIRINTQGTGDVWQSRTLVACTTRSTMEARLAHGRQRQQWRIHYWPHRA